MTKVHARRTAAHAGGGPVARRRADRTQPTWPPPPNRDRAGARSRREARSDHTLEGLHGRHDEVSFPTSGSGASSHASDSAGWTRLRTSTAPPPAVARGLHLPDHHGGAPDLDRPAMALGVTARVTTRPTGAPAQRLIRVDRPVPRATQPLQVQRQGLLAAAITTEADRGRPRSSSTPAPPARNVGGGTTTAPGGGGSAARRNGCRAVCQPTGLGTGRARSMPSGARQNGRDGEVGGAGRVQARSAAATGRQRGAHDRGCRCRRATAREDGGDVSLAEP